MDQQNVGLNSFFPTGQFEIKWVLETLTEIHGLIFWLALQALPYMSLTLQNDYFVS